MNVKIHGNKGKKRPEMTGEKHPLWKGGIAKNEEYQKIIHKEYFRKTRNAVIEILGGKCIKCGFSDKRALQIDHINGGGSKERKERNFKKEFNRYVLNSFLKEENKYQLLCANCNWIKRSENNENRT